METIICPKCQTNNYKDLSFCKNCDYPLKKAVSKKRKRSKTIIFFFFILFMMVLSISALVFVHFQYPRYGLKKRIIIVLDLFIKEDYVKIKTDYLDKYQNYQKLVDEIKAKQAQLTSLSHKINEQNSLFDRMTDKLDLIRIRLKELETRVQKIKEKK